MAGIKRIRDLNNDRLEGIGHGERETRNKYLT